MLRQISFRTAILILGLMLSLASEAQRIPGMGINYTDHVRNADCSYATDGWNLLTEDSVCVLRQNTSDMRYMGDGSGMQPPFIEYYVPDSLNLQLADARIVHDRINGLPAGRYTMSVDVRLYEEKGYEQPADGTTFFFANGDTVDVTEDAEYTSYGDMQLCYRTVSIDFDVDNEGVIDFGFIIGYANYNSFALRNVRLFFHPDITIHSQTYYIKHLATGKYLSTGARWDTQAIVSEVPTPVLLECVVGNVFSFKCPATNKYFTQLSENIWADAVISSWQLISQSDIERVCRIQGENGLFMGVDWQDAGMSINMFAEPQEWLLITEEEMRAAFATASVTNPVDATFLVRNPGFSRNTGGYGWEGEPTLDGLAGSFPESNFCAEKYNCTFNVFQKIEGIPNGRYRASIQGFYRNGGVQAAAAAYADSTETLLAEFYANDEKVPMMSIFSDACDSMVYSNDVNTVLGFVPDRMDGASQHFRLGRYAGNTVDVIVRDSTLTIGIRKDSLVAADWTIFDNVRLAYLGSETGSGDETDERMQELMTATPDNPKDASFLLRLQADSVIYGLYNKSQILSDIPNGLYKLETNGFYRFGRYDPFGKYFNVTADNDVYANYTQAYALVNRKNGTEIQFARMFANDEQTGLMSPFEYAHDTLTHEGDLETELGWVPNTAEAARQAFEAGEYLNQLSVYVTDGILTLGIRKDGGYKDDWAIWNDLRLTYYGEADMVYATGIEVEETSISLAQNEKAQIHVRVLPDSASVKHVSYLSSNESVATVDADGVVTAHSSGATEIIIRPKGGNGAPELEKKVYVTVALTDGDPAQLVINEIQVDNNGMFIDPSYNYGSWIEVYNPTDRPVSLEGLTVTDDAGQTDKFRLITGVAPAHGFANIWFDHNDANSANVNFKLNAEGGEIFLYSGSNLIASQQYPQAMSRTSYARNADGTGEWMITAKPTPMASNALSEEFISADAPRLDAPQAMPSSQIFTDSITVSVEIPDSAQLIYTLDGSAPTMTNGTVSQTGEFTFRQSTVLRMFLRKTGMIPSSVVTYSFILRDRDYTLPVLSVVSDPVNFYDSEIGVLTVGTNGKSGAGQELACNWNMPWERPVNMEYITADGTLAVNQEVDLERCGGWSRSWFPYSYRLKADKQYDGNNSINYPFFEADKPFNKYKVLQIRNGGNDLLCRVKDVYMNQVVLTSGLYVDAISYQPVHSFVNGVYQGVLNIREPNNKHFSYSNYGIDNDDLDQFEFNSADIIKVGDRQQLNEILDLADLAADPITYRELGTKLDIDEFANYWAVQMFLGGDDWPTNNCKAFIGKTDGRLHFVLFDLDHTLRYNERQVSRLIGVGYNSAVILWNRLMKNSAKFRRQFLDAYSIVAGSVFETERTHRILDEVARRVEMPLSFEGLTPWTTTEESKRILTAERREKMIKAVADHEFYGVYGKQCPAVTLSSNVEGARIQINGLDVPTGSFDGNLYYPATVTATAPMGYTFVCWQDTAGIAVSDSASFTLPENEPQQLTAVFRSTSETVPPICINEVSAGNSVNVNTDYYKKDDWIELYNTTDQPIDVAGMYLSDDELNPRKFQIPSDSLQQTVIPAHGHLIIWASKRETTSTCIHANFKLSNKGENLVMLMSEDETWCDILRYQTHGGQESVGRYPDGGNSIYRMKRPTIKARNTITTDSDYLYFYYYLGMPVPEIARR